MATFLLTSFGNLINLNQMTGPIFNSDTNTVDWGVIKEKLPSLTALNNYKKHYETTISVATDALTLKLLQTVVLEFQETNIDLAIDVLHIYGLGFNKLVAPVTLFFDDVGGGQDINGYTHTCTIVDDNHIVTAPATYVPGGETVGKFLLYLRDANGVLTNSIDATNPSGSLLTIP